jgi:acetyl-CoA synthetase
MHRQFRWQVPREFNMAEVCMRRWAASAATARRTAIVEHRAEGASQRFTYAQLQQAADALSHALLSLGVQRGDRVAIVLPQRFETAVSYMAVLQIGAVAMPLSLLSRESSANQCKTCGCCGFGGDPVCSRPWQRARPNGYGYVRL